jgi:sulfide:quinone oxidoreductase
MRPRILVLGAGFGGLELSTLLSESLGDTVEVTLIDKSDHFIFGFSKLDVMFGHAEAHAVRLPFKNFTKPGVRMLQQTITSIDPAKRRITTDKGQFEADYLVVALGAEYDFAATPGLADVTEFYSEAAIAKIRDVLPKFTRGRALIGVCGVPYKCPPAPSGCALMLHDYLVKRGVRRDCEIDFVLPQPAPVPPSPETSRALVEAFTERGIKFHPNKRVASIDGTKKIGTLDDGVGLRSVLRSAQAPSAAVVLDSGLAEGGWVTVNPRTLETKFANVYAMGDCANTGTPKAGVFAEGAAKAVATTLIARSGRWARQWKMAVPEPATSSSATALSARSRWISSPGRSRSGAITSPRRLYAQTRNISAPPAAPAGLACEGRKLLRGKCSPSSPLWTSSR